MLREKGNRCELRRVTDREQKTPFSPYDLRLFKQTYYGIGHIIEPLLREELARFPPMEEASPGKPWVIEICPAATLKKENLYFAYKGKDSEHCKNRMRILKRIEQIGNFKIPGSLQTKILNESNGDALDSVIAVFAANRAARHLTHDSVTKNPIYRLEGYVYT